MLYSLLYCKISSKIAKMTEFMFMDDQMLDIQMDTESPRMLYFVFKLFFQNN